jgi:hypothetical protein
LIKEPTSADHPLLVDSGMLARKPIDPLPSVAPRKVVIPDYT